MELFTNTYLTDIPLIFGLADENAQAAERLYRERYPQRDGCQMFINLHHNLREYGSLRGDRHSESESRVLRTSSMEQNVLHAVRRNPSTSV
ncbi:hypothetical protein TNCV_2299661 [Trichonephila clavipes]|nr:hypothetical protein TNCV_2299661 [Trichonephila clavipes]